MYRLRNHHRRSLLTFAGPLFILSYYVFICRAFLVKPPSNGIVETVYPHARWFYYIWFILAIFALDWSRAGLANIEAAALMHRSLAPSTATGLMWHTDSKWSNPLWWARAIFALLAASLRRFRSVKHPLTSTPGLMWMGLGFVTLLIFVALPLSGLTMEIGNVYSYNDTAVTIYGPNETSFNWRSVSVLQQQILTQWESGRQTSPLHSTMLYAPEGTENVSTTYYDDLANQRGEFIEFFAGPAVREPVYGRAWGIHANISCRCVPKDKLQMLQVRQFEFAVQSCNGNSTSVSCQFGQYHNALNQTTDKLLQQAKFPTWVNGSGNSGTSTVFSYVAVADGYSGYYSGALPPFVLNSSHDNATFDYVVNKRPLNDTTTGMFEIYLWEYVWGGDDDTLFNAMTKGDFPEPVDAIYLASKNITFAGMAVHCDITTAVGNANLDPAHRTYSSFSRLAAWSNLAWNIIQQYTGFEVIQELYAPQVLAMFSLVNGEQGIGENNTFGFSATKHAPRTDQVWVALHNAIGTTPMRPLLSSRGSDAGFTVYQPLRPSDLQLGMYKLLGESVIALMDEGGVNPWTGELFALKSSSYLVVGAVSWIYVVVLLSLWALLMCFGACWTALCAGPRWASTLDGFEMFKFGAQYAHEINELESVEFRSRNSVLYHVPGMVGMLPGSGNGSNNKERLGFIGLSENLANKSSRYTLDRRQAATARPSQP